VRYKVKMGNRPGSMGSVLVRGFFGHLIVVEVGGLTRGWSGSNAEARRPTSGRRRAGGAGKEPASRGSSATGERQPGVRRSSKETDRCRRREKRRQTTGML